MAGGVEAGFCCCCCCWIYKEEEEEEGATELVRHIAASSLPPFVHDLLWYSQGSMDCPDNSSIPQFWLLYDDLPD
jgi:hypothetical protein